MKRDTPSNQRGVKLVDIDSVSLSTLEICPASSPNG